MVGLPVIFSLTVLSFAHRLAAVLSPYNDDLCDLRRHVNPPYAASPCGLLLPVFRGLFECLCVW